MDDMGWVWRGAGRRPLATLAGIGIGSRSPTIDPLLVELAQVVFYTRELSGAREVGTVDTFDAQVEAEGVSLSPNEGVSNK